MSKPRSAGAGAVLGVEYLVMDTHSSTLKGIRQQLAADLGKIDKFSLDALVNMLNAAGRHVSLRVKKAA